MNRIIAEIAIDAPGALLKPKFDRTKFKEIPKMSSPKSAPHPQIKPQIVSFVMIGSSSTSSANGKRPITKFAVSTTPCPNISSHSTKLKGLYGIENVCVRDIASDPKSCGVVW